MKHHVTCAICEKKDYIPVGYGIEKSLGWFYGGKVNVNLNQKVPSKFAEYWECPKCSGATNANHCSSEKGKE